jgi:hypothetical protein
MAGARVARESIDIFRFCRAEPQLAGMLMVALFVRGIFAPIVNDVAIRKLVKPGAVCRMHASSHLLQGGHGLLPQEFQE